MSWFPLFEVGNSDFGNYVRYSINVDGEKHEFKAKWVNRDSKEEYRDLNLIENQFAYGFSVKNQKDGEYLIVTSVKDFPLRVVNHSSGWGCIIKINGRENWLHHIWVQTKKGIFKIPKVDYIDIFAYDIQTNAEVTHRIT